MTVVFALLLILVLLACWFLTLLGLPGNWLMVDAVPRRTTPVASGTVARTERVPIHERAGAAVSPGP